jgi:hypothetical protein
VGFEIDLGLDLLIGDDADVVLFLLICRERERERKLKG